MRGVLYRLAKRLRLPTNRGFAELDMQIEKLRMLRDSYQTAQKLMHNERHADLKKI